MTDHDFDRDLEAPEQDQEELTDDDFEYVTVQYEDGTSEECMIIGVFDFEDDSFIGLAPESDDSSIILYHYIELEDGQFQMKDIEDDDLFERLSDYFNKACAEALESEGLD